MENKDDLITEYKALREEIKTNSQLTAQVFTIAMTASAALIGYGLQASYWPIFLSPFAILIPSLYFISSQLESTTRIAAYMQIYIEPKLEGLNWETEFLNLRKNKLLPARRKYRFSISGLYGAVGFVCLLLSWLFLKPYSIKNIAIISVASIILIILMANAILIIQRAFKIEFCLEYNESWRKLIGQKK